MNRPLLRVIYCSPAFAIRRRCPQFILLQCWDFTDKSRELPICFNLGASLLNFHFPCFYNNKDKSGAYICM
jgi:hypothetical protein